MFRYTYTKSIDLHRWLCRVVKGFRHLVVGAIGARTTAFKTVRFDEVALQRVGITVETFDLSGVIERVKSLSAEGSDYKEKLETLHTYTTWDGVPDAALDKIVRLGVVLDELIEEYTMDAIAIRCWVELQEQMGISPCVLLGLLNNTGTIAACEVDVCNAVAMAALSLASGRPATVLDWNNNYGEEDEKCILFHCGPVPRDLMTNKGRVSDHLILANAVGENQGFGCVVGRIAPSDLTFGSMMTDAGRIKVYLGDGRFTDDPIPENFFGAAGVAEISGLQDVLLHVGMNGYRHHVSVTTGKHVAPIQEALEKYLDFDVSVPQVG
jgi:L-fucose isomerase-like protein